MLRVTVDNTDNLKIMLKFFVIRNSRLLLNINGIYGLILLQTNVSKQNYIFKFKLYFS